MNSEFELSLPVQIARQNNQPIVALESAVFTHGLPFPENIALGKNLEKEILDNQATPATIALLHGKIKIGLTNEELEYLGNPATPTRKISRRDFGIALANGLNGGTTVSATLIAAHRAGIKVFATGGIGGVHRNAPFDVSADLVELSHTPMIVVCAGAKSILDLPATLEVLETYGVPVIGYQTDEFPAFYSRESGLPVDFTVTSPEQVAEIALQQWQIGLSAAVLLVIPPPAEIALPYQVIEEHIADALAEAEAQHIRGAAMTPFLLSRISHLSGGSSLQANLSLLRNNASIAAKVAAAISKQSITPKYHSY